MSTGCRSQSQVALHGSLLHSYLNLDCYVFHVGKSVVPKDEEQGIVAGLGACKPTCANQSSQVDDGVSCEAKGLKKTRHLRGAHISLSRSRLMPIVVTQPSCMRHVCISVCARARGCVCVCVCVPVCGCVSLSLCLSACLRACVGVTA